VSRIFVRGCGAVSSAGWGTGALRKALANGGALAATQLARPGKPAALQVRPVPAPIPRPAFLTQPRLRRTSPVSQFAMGAASEALENAGDCKPAINRIGFIVCVMAGCVAYSRRFYAETLADPSTASPVIFPETVFNAPSSHIAAVFGSTAHNYTFVGDPGTFLIGLATGAQWLSTGIVDGCVVVATEELDWLSADAFGLFDPDVVVSEGAGALFLQADADGEGNVELAAITDPHLFVQGRSRADAARAMRAQLPESCPTHLLCDSAVDCPRLDAGEDAAWADWTGSRCSPKRILGESLAGGSALQCVAAVDALVLNRYSAATVSVVGCNQQAIGAHFLNWNR
jgi:hypothetical protein